MVAEVVDVVIGVDTHRDSHEVEIADPRPPSWIMSRLIGLIDPAEGYLRRDGSGSSWAAIAVRFR